ncbi:hypothetical protein [Aeromonas bestiarum]|uniref:hypothetical protein n=1 Tax=Aeromonas bestiarum TaxID=105751 RepID=UPI003EBD83BE
MTHVSESNARAEELVVCICAVLLAKACNIGLEPRLKHQVCPLSPWGLRAPEGVAPQVE